MGEPGYPKVLAAAEDAPPLIGLCGDAAVLQRPMVAVIGSRNASALGLRFTESLARDLGEAGFVVVSGLARGINARAHQATPATGTVAVSPEGMSASIRARTGRRSSGSSRAGPRSPKCRSPASRAGATFRGATASSRGLRVGWW